MEFFKQIQKRRELCNEPPGHHPSFNNFFWWKAAGGRIVSPKRISASPDSGACVEVAFPRNAGAVNSSETRPDYGRAGPNPARQASSSELTRKRTRTEAAHVKTRQGRGCSDGPGTPRSPPEGGGRKASGQSLGGAQPALL